MFKVCSMGYVLSYCAPLSSGLKVNIAFESYTLQDL